MCNDNILINTDFTNPVNQRGQTEYTASGYCIDGWILGNDTTLLLDNNAVSRINFMSPSNITAQKVEDISRLIGTVVTYSLYAENVNGNIYMTDMSGLALNHADIKISNGLNKWTFVIAPNTDNNGGIGFWGNAGSSFKPIAAKLELGTVSTLENEVVDYAEQLCKCQRYYLRLLPTRVTTAFAYNATTASSIFDVGEMRIQPSLAGYKNVNILTKDGWKTCDRVNLVGYSRQGMSLDFITNDLTPGEAMIINIAGGGYIDFSAEL